MLTSVKKYLKNGIVAYANTVVYTCCYDANAIINRLAENGISLPPCAPVQQGQGAAASTAPAAQATLLIVVNHKQFNKFL